MANCGGEKTGDLAASEIIYFLLPDLGGGWKTMLLSIVVLT